MTIKLASRSLWWWWLSFISSKKSTITQSPLVWFVCLLFFDCRVPKLGTNHIFHCWDARSARTASKKLHTPTIADSVNFPQIGGLWKHIKSVSSWCRFDVFAHNVISHILMPHRGANYDSACNALDLAGGAPSPAPASRSRSMSFT